MMVGNNSLRLCSAEVCNALQHYLTDHVFKQPVKVLAFDSSGDRHSPEFAVLIEQDPPTKEPTP